MMLDIAQANNLRVTQGTWPSELLATHVTRKAILELKEKPQCIARLSEVG